LEERLQKLMAAAGVCSRRQAEAWIAAGRVRLNGVTAALGDKADRARDEITVDGKPLPGRPAFVYVMLNKPAGYVTTLSDEKGRPTVLELVRGVKTRVFPVGRLDLMSEGLLLLTNDGTLAQRLTHPSYKAEKGYRLWVSGGAEDAAERLAAVRELDGEAIRPASVRLLRRGKGGAVLSVILRQGKNRQIRRMCAACGLTVRRLRRVREHTLRLGDLQPGQWRYLTEEEVRRLLSLEGESRQREL